MSRARQLQLEVAGTPAPARGAYFLAGFPAAGGPASPPAKRTYHLALAPAPDAPKDSPAAALARLAWLLPDPEALAAEVGDARGAIEDVDASGGPPRQGKRRALPLSRAPKRLLLSPGPVPSDVAQRMGLRPEHFPESVEAEVNVRTDPDRVEAAHEREMMRRGNP